MSNNKKGVVLDKLKVIQVWSDSFKGNIRYYFEHNTGEHGPYEAYIPKGQAKALRLQERIGLSNQDSQNQW